MACLKQTLKGSKLEINTDCPERLTEKGLPIKLTLELEINPATDMGEYVERETAKARYSYAGYKFPEQVNKWFSVAINKEIFAVRSPKHRTWVLSGYRQ